MRDEYFDVPVTIETSQPGKHQVISRTRQAAEWLVGKWPEKRGPKYRKAVEAVMAVMEQRKAVAVARKAFSDAAKEADIFVAEPHPHQRRL